MGGITISIPKIFTKFSNFSMASLALPRMSDFVAKFMIFLGIINNHNYSSTFQIIITTIVPIGMILTPIYLLSMLCRIFYGYKVFNVPSPYFQDLGPCKLFILICLFLPIIGIGLYPNLVLFLYSAKVEAIFQGFWGQYP